MSWSISLRANSRLLRCSLDLVDVCNDRLYTYRTEADRNPCLWYPEPEHKSFWSYALPETDAFWDVYWETRLQPLENLGKRAAILAASRLIRELSLQAGRPLRILELGCGEGQVIGALMDAHFQECSREYSAAVDYSEQSLARCRQDFPGLRCVHGDFSDAGLLAGLLNAPPDLPADLPPDVRPEVPPDVLPDVPPGWPSARRSARPVQHAANRPGAFDLVLLVNALHEVYSDCFSPELNQIDVPAAKQRVEQALAGAAGCLGPGGWLILFDGLEPSGDPNQAVRIRFRDYDIRREFDMFADGYRPFQITFRQLDTPLCVELSKRDFTRYLTKSIFLGKGLWESERLQSYQYFTQEEFRAAFARAGLDIVVLRTLTMNEEKWRYRVEIETPGIDFPDEHILILAQYSPSGSDTGIPSR